MLAPPAEADAPIFGARYDGQSATGERVFLRVSSDGTQLANYDFFAKLECSDGKRRPIGLYRRGEAPTTINSDGSFSYTSQFAPLALREGLRGEAQTSFTGRFSAGGDVVSGTISTTFRAGRVNCSNSGVPYTMYRNGTAGSPYRSPSIATGRYRDGGRGFRVFLKSFFPGRVVHPVRIRFREPCRNGATPSVGYTLRGMQLRGRTISRRLRTRTRLRGGFTVIDRVRFRSTFAYRGGYVALGRLTIRTRVLRRGRPFTRCGRSFGFRARFLGGPFGVEGPHPRA